MANTSAIWKCAAHTTDQLSSPSRYKSKSQTQSLSIIVLTKNTENFFFFFFWTWSVLFDTFCLLYKMCFEKASSRSKNNNNNNKNSFNFNFFKWIFWWPTLGSERMLREDRFSESLISTFQVLHGAEECDFSCWQCGFVRHHWYPDLVSLVWPPRI